MRSILLIMATAIMLSCNNEAGTDEEKSEVASDTLTSTGTNEAAIKEEAVTYNLGGTTMNGFVAYDTANKSKLPIVLVVHEWWGLTDYPRMRAKQLAQLGYFAMAVDMYGDGKLAGNPDEAQKAAMPFYKDPQEATARLNAALTKAKSYAMADTSKTAAIGYCFGGSMVLNAAKLGADYDGVVSFHGGLEGVPAKKDLLKAKIFVAHGAADNFVPQEQVDAFRKNLDSVGADYTFKVYPDATHAFTNPDADKKAAEFKMPIKYNGTADTASWNDMKTFLSGIFK